MYDYRPTDIDLTLEVSSIKWPSGASLPGFWEENLKSMLAFCLSATKTQTMRAAAPSSTTLSEPDYVEE